jgi:hypothetical protein
MPNKPEISANAEEGKREAEAAMKATLMTELAVRLSNNFSLSATVLAETKDDDTEKLNQISAIVDELRTAVRLIPRTGRESIDDQEARVRPAPQEEKIIALEAQEARIRRSLLGLFGIK